jgi:hypothetical protein
MGKQPEQYPHKKIIDGLYTKHAKSMQGHPEFLLNIVFMDIYLVPLKEGRRAKGAGQAPQNYVRVSRFAKMNFVAKQFA